MAALEKDIEVVTGKSHENMRLLKSSWSIETCIKHYTLPTSKSPCLIQIFEKSCANNNKLGCICKTNTEREQVKPSVWPVPSRHLNVISLTSPNSHAQPDPRNQTWQIPLRFLFWFLRKSVSIPSGLIKPPDEARCSLSRDIYFGSANRINSSLWDHWEQFSHKYVLADASAEERNTIVLVYSKPPPPFPSKFNST